MIPAMTDMPDITGYRFGSITISGQAVTSDLMIFPDGRIESGWRRKSGHLLVFDDIRDLAAAEPDRIIVGTGAYDRMDIADNLKSRLESINPNIECFCLKTEDAVKHYNQSIRKPGRTAACFHLTC